MEGCVAEVEADAVVVTVDVIVRRTVFVDLFPPTRTPTATPQTATRTAPKRLAFQFTGSSLAETHRPRLARMPSRPKATCEARAAI